MLVTTPVSSTLAPGQYQAPEHLHDTGPGTGPTSGHWSQLVDTEQRFFVVSARARIICPIHFYLVK